MSARRRSRADLFYGSALDAAGRDDLAEALAIEGLDEEVALLRLRLRESLEQHPEDIELLHRGVRLLIQSLLAQHRLSPRQAVHLGEAVANVIEEFGTALGLGTASASESWGGNHDAA